MQAGWRLAVRSRTEQLTYDDLVRRFEARIDTLPYRYGHEGTTSGGPEFIAEALAALDRRDGSGRTIGMAGSPVLRGPAEFGLLSADRPRQWLRGISWLQWRYPLSEHDTMLHAATAGSPAAVFETLWPLCVGATVASVAASSPLSRLLACYRYRVAVLILSVPELDELLAVQAERGLMAPPSLRRVICLDGPISRGLSRRFAERLGRHHAVLCSGPARQQLVVPAGVDTLAPTGQLSSIG
jgi:hypothetical protein